MQIIQVGTKLLPVTRTKVTWIFFCGFKRIPFKFRQLDFDFRDFSGFKLMFSTYIEMKSVEKILL